MSAISLLRLTVYGSLLSVLSFAAIGCSNSRWQEVRKNPNTGDSFSERQRQQPPRDLQPKDHVFTTPDRLPTRKDSDTTIEESPEVLPRNQELEVVDPTPRGKNGLIEVVVIDAGQPDLPKEHVFVPPPYVSKTPVTPAPEVAAADRYIVIENVASEKLRVYERCVKAEANGDCPHRLVLETDMVAGENTPSTRTNLGSYKITEWFKFYEDPDNHVPTWLAAPYPAAKVTQSSSFGWYTARIGPDADAQWTHGTFGWAKDGTKYIDLAREGKIPRSMGCSRVENQAIAWMRANLPAGTALLKVYAKEAYTDSDRTRYQNFELAKWDWLLTKTGKGSEVLERGTYTPDQVPDVVDLIGQRNGATAKNGNLYDIPLADFKGKFLVDEGRFIGYEHPRGLKVGGHAEHKLPKMVLK
jgi:hypothetical protein